MRFEFLLPIVLFVVYLINVLINKEKAPPPRGLSPTSRTGGSLPPAPRPAMREPALRVPSPASTRPATQRRPSPGEEIVVITGDSARGSRPQQPRPGQSNPQRRPARPRTGTNQPSAARSEPAPERAVRGWVSQTVSQASVSQTIDRPLDVRPLSELQSASTTNFSGQTTSVASAAPLPISSSADIRRLIYSPTALRDALVVSELLQPPIALRGKR